MSAGVSPSGAASACSRDRSEAFEPAAQDLDQRLLRRPVALRVVGRRGDRRARAARPATAPGIAAAARRRSTRLAPGRCSRAARWSSSSREPAAPARRAADLLVAEKAEPDQRVVQLVGIGRARARLPRAPARSPRGRAGRDRRRPRAPASAGPSPPGCGAPRAARRRDRRRAAPTSTSSASGEGSVRSRVDDLRPRPPRCGASSRSSPSMSIASLRQSAIVWRTSGWSGISRSPARFSAQASWSGKIARDQVLGLHARQLRRHLLAAAEARQRQRHAARPSASAS